MIVTIGKHKGMPAESVVLKHANYAFWVLGETKATGSLKALRSEFQRLFAILDEKPFARSCDGCERAATRASFYRNNPEVAHVWCDDCDPYSTGANNGTLTVVKDAAGVRWYVLGSCGGRASDLDVAVRTFARAKGLPTRITESKAAEFFT